MSLRPRDALDLALIVSICCAAALLRCIFLLDDVFAEGFTRFAGNDAWYQVRVAESAFANFPEVLRYDPYLLLPDGHEVPVAPLLPFLIAAVARLLGSADLLAPVAAWIPVILGAATVIPVWATARIFWGRGGAALAAALTAFLPGEFLRRSLLGNADQHVLEVFLSSTLFLFLALALDRRKLRFAVIAGATLALYLLGWTSGAMLVFILTSAAFAVVVVSAGADAVALRMFTTAFTTSALLVAWFSRGDALVCAVGAAVTGSALLARRVTRGKAAFFALWLGGAIVAGLVALALEPAYFQKALLNAHRWMPRAEARLVTEAAPLFATSAPGRFLLREFHAAGVVALAALAAFTFAAMRSRRAAEWLLVVWSVAMALAAWRQIRFLYYLVPVVALLSAWAWTRASAAAPSGRARWVGGAVAALVLLLPNARGALRTASVTDGPGDQWVRAMAWLRTSTPPPFASGDPYLAPPRALRDQRAQWGVLAWWDYGYWITQMAHRVPTANPTQRGASTTAKILLDDGAAGSAAARALGARYVVLDRTIPVSRPKEGGYSVTTIDAVSRWAGHSPARYFDHYESDSGLMLLFHPEYFRSLAVHLTSFRGEAVQPSESWVATIVPGGERHRVRELRRFDRWEDAAAFADADPPRRRIVSRDPMLPCVPLPALPWRRVYAAEGEPPAIQIFEAAE